MQEGEELKERKEMTNYYVIKVNKIKSLLFSLRNCPPDYVCLPNLAENPDNGWTSFDHFGLAMLNTLQLITLDYWERLYELVRPEHALLIEKSS